MLFANPHKFKLPGAGLDLPESYLSPVCSFPLVRVSLSWNYGNSMYTKARGPLWRASSLLPPCDTTNPSKDLTLGGKSSSWAGDAAHRYSA